MGTHRMLGMVAFLSLIGLTVMAQNNRAGNRIDTIRPDAPALTALGRFQIGVKTLRLVNPGQLDILKARPGEAAPTYDRPLTVEVWYPARLQAGQSAGGTYRVMTRDGKTEVTLSGKAVRDAAPDTSSAPYPLVIVSHGYPGNRFLLSHFGENLASKGYVVASIDHTDSLYNDQAAFSSTLYNRPLDQMFVLREMARLNQTDASLRGMVNADATGLIGYSMGGYGALNAVGGGFTAASTRLSFGPPNGLLEGRQAGNPQYTASLDKRVKAAILIGPWGWNAGFWDAEGLKGIRTPVFFMAGSADDVSGYAPGVRNIFEASLNADRYLLTFENARHNAAGPIPAPRETFARVPNLNFIPAEAYNDPVWDTVRMNNIAQHFTAAFFGKHLKGDANLNTYLEVPQKPTDGAWRGFADRANAGLRLEHKTP